jgi:cobalt transporter subunit CbtB
MATANNTVHDRIEQARMELTPTQLAAGLALVAALGFALLFVQEPMLHDSMHNFRHAAGITCH